MTINTINTIGNLGGYESKRLEQLDQQRLEIQKGTQQQDSGTDRISISDEGRIKANMLKAAHDHDGVRAELVADAKARIESGEYKVEGKDVAAAMLQQELDVWG